jgi:hypothetical protein
VNNFNTKKIGTEHVSFFTKRADAITYCNKLLTQTMEQHQPIKIKGFGWLAMNVVTYEVREGALYHDAFGPLSALTAGEIAKNSK